MISFIKQAKQAGLFDKIKHMMISNVTGEFTSINGVLDLDENDITQSKVRASIDATTISTVG